MEWPAHLPLVRGGGVSVGITDQNDTHLFTLIHHSGYFI